MLPNFRSYQLSVELYQACKKTKVPSYLKDQLLRASSSVSLNLAEGSAKSSTKERQRYYNIAFASLREVQAVIDLEKEQLKEIHHLADMLGGHLYKLCHSN